MKNSDNKQFPVEFLKDEKGIYGIAYYNKKGVVKRQLILRPDMLPLSETKRSALQMIPKGRLGKYFEHTVEDLYIDKIWAGILKREGLKSYNKWICSNEKKSIEESRKYHGSKHAARLIINRLIHEALEKAADPLALQVSRRFVPNYRYDVYHAVAQSVRARQLAEVFPVLALSIFRDRLEREDDGLVRGAKRLIESGTRLRDIATLMGVPMSFRHVKPGAAHLALRVVDAVDDPRLLEAYLPTALPKMKKWFRCLIEAQRGGKKFVEWAARHAFEIEGDDYDVYDTIRNVSDWVRASNVAVHGGNELDIRELQQSFIFRPFNPGMSVGTVMSLSDEWHVIVADNFTGERNGYPEPWCPGGSVDGYEILPITSNGELYLEGKIMKHCVGTCTNYVLAGTSYFYSVRRDGERVATVELERDIEDYKVELGEIKASCNARPPSDLLRAVRRWFKAQSGFRSITAEEVMYFHKHVD